MLLTQEDSAGGTADPHYVWRTVALRNGPLAIFIKLVGCTAHVRICTRELRLQRNLEQLMIKRIRYKVKVLVELARNVQRSHSNDAMVWRH